MSDNDNVSEDERVILIALMVAMEKGKQADAPLLSKVLGWTVPRVEGALGQLEARGFVKQCERGSDR
jgi:hypothetical protein